MASVIQQACRLLLTLSLLRESSDAWGLFAQLGAEILSIPKVHIDLQLPPSTITSWQLDIKGDLMFSKLVFAFFGLVVSSTVLPIESSRTGLSEPTPAAVCSCTTCTNGLSYCGTSACSRDTVSYNCDSEKPNFCC